MVMLKTNTQTIELDGSEQEVRFNRNYSYFWVQNQGDSDVLISINSGIAEGKDGVMTILGGGGTGCTMHGYDLDRFYLLGTGKVQVVGTYCANCPFKAAQGGGDKYTLPVATTDILGGVKVDGTTITADENGVISAGGGGGSSVQSDILLDITVTKGDTSNGDYSSCSPPNNSIITLAGDIADYKFIYFINGDTNIFNTAVGNEATSLTPSFIFIDDSYDIGDEKIINSMNYIGRFIYISSNQIKIEFFGRAGTRSCRYIIIGIK